MTTTIAAAVAARPGSPEKAAAAFAKIAPELSALATSELIRVNVNIPRAVSTALGTCAALMALRPRLLAELPAHPIQTWDGLEAYALGTLYTHLLALPATSPDNPVKPLSDEAASLRSTLLIDAEALAHRGLLDGARVAEIRKGQGNIDTASDLVALSALFDGAWGRLEGKTATTRAELDRAEELGSALLAALGVHASAPRSHDELTDQRQRAFTLFANAYDQCRRAVAYLRWEEGDLEAIAPSIYTYPRKAKAKPAPDPTTEPAPELSI